MVSSVGFAIFVGDFSSYAVADVEVFGGEVFSFCDHWAGDGETVVGVADYCFDAGVLEAGAEIVIVVLSVFLGMAITFVLDFVGGGISLFGIHTVEKGYSVDHYSYFAGGHAVGGVCINWVGGDLEFDAGC